MLGTISIDLVGGAIISAVLGALKLWADKKATDARGSLTDAVVKGTGEMTAQLERIDGRLVSMDRELGSIRTRLADHDERLDRVGA